MNTIARLKPSRYELKPSRYMGIVALALAFGVAACSSESAPAPASAPPVSTRTPIGQLPAIDTAALLAHVKQLSSDEFEGRGPGTKGEELSVTYLADQFKKVGLKPGNSDGTFFQKVPLVGITPTPAPLIFSKGGQKGSQRQTLKWKDDVVAWTKHVADVASIDNSELVLRRLRRCRA